MKTLVMTDTTFDVVEYIKKLRNAGVNQEVAEIQGQELEHVINNVLKQSKELFDSKELATKGYIREAELRLEKEIEMVRKEIAESSTKTIVWTAGLLGTFGVFFLGILAKGFHWL